MMRGLMEQQKTCEFYAEHIGKFDPRCLLALLPFLGQPYRKFLEHQVCRGWAMRRINHRKSVGWKSPLMTVSWSIRPALLDGLMLVWILHIARTRQRVSFGQ